MTSLEINYEGVTSPGTGDIFSHGSEKWTFNVAAEDPYIYTEDTTNDFYPIGRYRPPSVANTDSSDPRSLTPVGAAEFFKTDSEGEEPPEWMEGWDTFEPSLQLLAREATRRGSMAPIIKQELKLKILAKRHQDGKPDIPMELLLESQEEKGPQDLVEISAEEKERLDSRKLKNRLAARKCRNKKKQEIQTLKTIIRTLKDSTRKLSHENHDLKRQVQILTTQGCLPQYTL